MSSVSAKESAKDLFMTTKRDKRENLADYVRRTIREKGLTYRGIAERARRGGFKLSHSTVGEILKNPQTGFGIDTLRAVACGMGVPQDEVISRAAGTGEDNPSEYRRQLVERLFEKMETDTPDKAKYTETLILAVLGEGNLGESHSRNG